jgi:hypothetical protein
VNSDGGCRHHLLCKFSLAPLKAAEGLEYAWVSDPRSYGLDQALNTPVDSTGFPVHLGAGRVRSGAFTIHFSIKGINAFFDVVRVHQLVLAAQTRGDCAAPPGRWLLHPGFARACVQSHRPCLDQAYKLTDWDSPGKEVVMADSLLFRFNGQAAYVVDTGRLKKIRVVFGMIDEKRTSMAWYLFSSDGVAKSKRELANPDNMPPEQFGHRDVGGRDIPHTFTRKIGLDGLAFNPKGTTATLTLDLSDTKRFIECRIDKPMTKAKEVVSFPFGLQHDSDPPKKGEIPGRVLFLGPAPFDANQFILGPQGKAQTSIFGPGV